MNLGILTSTVFSIRAKMVVHSSSSLVRVFPKDAIISFKNNNKKRAKMVRKFKDTISKNCGI